MRQLRYLDALARHSHFGRAAEASAISQPALSVQIKDLEAALGTKLFERSARQVRLTGFGEEVSARVRDILRSIEELGALASARGDGMAWRLRIGVIPTVAPYLLPAILSRLATDYRELDIHVRETVTPRLAEELSDGRLDAAIVALPVSEPAFAEVPLFSEAMLLVRPASEAGEPVPGRSALRDMRLLLLEEGHCFRDQALSFCGIPSARPRDGLDGSSLSTLVQMVGAGMGVTLIPEMAARVEGRAAPVALSRFGRPEPRRTIGMIWRRSSPLAKRLDEVAGAVRDAAQAVTDGTAKE